MENQKVAVARLSGIFKCSFSDQLPPKLHNKHPTPSNKQQTTLKMRILLPEVVIRLSTEVDKILVYRFSLSSRSTRIVKTLVVSLVLCLIYYTLSFPFSYIFGRSSSPHKEWVIPKPGTDPLKHFSGSKECNVTQSDIYLVPPSITPEASSFCKNRATLLEALGDGGRDGFDEPYVGKDCTYRWFRTHEICMILERFSAIIFIGHDAAHSIYTAFNILLREDFRYGGLRQWSMSKQDRQRCECDRQFLNDDCAAYRVTRSEEVTNNTENEGNESHYYCERVPHSYIPISNKPASSTSQATFKDLTYHKPHPWQPSPVIFAKGYDSTAADTQSLDEWLALAAAAERNIPFLFVGPVTSLVGFDDPWAYMKQMRDAAVQRNVDVLGLWNLTFEATSVGGRYFGKRVALVEAMMVVNWLSMLETS